MIDKGGIYTIPLHDYVRDPAPVPSLSASIAHILLMQSPLHAKLQHPRLNPSWHQKDASRFDIGTVAHQILLEGHRQHIVTVDADDWRTKAAKEQRDAARASGQIAVLTHQMADIEAMVKVAQAAIVQSEIVGPLQEGTPEQTLVWQEGGIWLRCRPDWLAVTRRFILDYKTTSGSAEPNTWLRTGLLANGYDLQAAINLRGYHTICGGEARFVFLVQETEPPYAVSFVGMEPSFLAHAAKKLDRAIGLWKDCLTTSTWPGYPSQVCYMQLPVWEEIRFAEVSP